jgi:hypothetical protein
MLLAAAMKAPDDESAEDETFTSRGDKLFALIDKDTRTETLLTTERELSMQKENVQLLGLDHPLVAAYQKSSASCHRRN